METNNADLELGNLFDVKGKVALVTGGGEIFSFPFSSNLVVCDRIKDGDWTVHLSWRRLWFVDMLRVLIDVSIDVLMMFQGPGSV